MSPASTDQGHAPETAEIRISAHGARRKLEAVYLELREFARQHGLEVEYRLTVKKPREEQQP